MPTRAGGILDDATVEAAAIVLKGGAQ